MTYDVNPSKIDLNAIDANARRLRAKAVRDSARAAKRWLSSLMTARGRTA